jgi:hypothetical protein
MEAILSDGAKGAAKMRLAVSVTALRGTEEDGFVIRGLEFPDAATARLFCRYIRDGVRLFRAQPGDKTGEPGFVISLGQEGQQSAAAGNGGGVPDELLAGLSWPEKGAAAR